MNSFQTNSGVLFLFQKDKYNLIYATSDFNSIENDVFKTFDTDSELYVGRKVAFNDVHYEITAISGYANWDRALELEDDQMQGTPNRYSYVMCLTVKEI